eukprot:1770848-Prymnesium_polylepis.2
MPRVLPDEGRGPEYEKQLDAALDRLEGLPVVNGDAKVDQAKRRVIVNMWCRASHPPGNLRQPCVALNKKDPLQDEGAVPTYLVATEKLINMIQRDHAGCLAAAEQAQRSAASSGSAGCGAGCDCTEAGTQRFQAMMRMESARKRASEANAVALAAEKARDAAELELAELERLVDPKAARADDEECASHKTVEDWDLADHRREMTRVMNRRKIQLGASESARELRTGDEGYLKHPRLGLIGAVGYWARGSLAVVVTIVTALIVKLNIAESVRAALPQTEADRLAKTNAKIVDLMEQACKS